MSKPVEIASTLAAVAGFVVVLAVAAATGHELWGGVLALAVFVALVSAAGYVIAVKKYDVDEEEEESEDSDDAGWDREEGEEPVDEEGSGEDSGVREEVDVETDAEEEPGDDEGEEAGGDDDYGAEVDEPDEG